MRFGDDTTLFFESLADLFYAIAVVDNRVRIAEKKKIKELVENDWTILNNDLDSQQIIFSRLKELFDNKYDKEKAFLNFSDFFIRHREDFSQEIKDKIMYTVNKIAVAFAGRNKSESVLISRLYFLMWKSDQEN